jgi:hypothetical protein
VDVKVGFGSIRHVLHRHPNEVPPTVDGIRKRRTDYFKDAFLTPGMIRNMEAGIEAQRHHGGTSDGRHGSPQSASELGVTVTPMEEESAELHAEPVGLPAGPNAAAVAAGMSCPWTLDSWYEPMFASMPDALFAISAVQRDFTTADILYALGLECNEDFYGEHRRVYSPPFCPPFP